LNHRGPGVEHRIGIVAFDDRQFFAIDRGAGREGQAFEIGPGANAYRAIAGHHRFDARCGAIESRKSDQHRPPG
jgi:hypothetical protein